jgi:tetratricopeptide (TPR) repeat protein
MKDLLFRIAIYILSLSTLSAQNIDSLKQALKIKQHDTSVVKTLNVLVESAPEGEWQRYNKQMEDLCEKALSDKNITGSASLFYKKHLAAALNNNSLTFQSEGNIAKALEYNRRALQLFEETNDKPNIAYSLNNLGYLYYNMGDIKQALEYQHRALKIQEQLQNKFGIASSLNFIAPIYEGQGESDKALEYYRRSLVINKEINNQQGIALCYNNIGFIYKNRENYPEALSYLEKAAAMYKEINNGEGYATAILNIGIIYQKNDPTKAMDYFAKALKIQEAMGDKKGIATSLHNIAYIYYHQKNYKKALEYCNSEYALTRQLGYPKYISDAAYLLKCIYQQQHQFEKALEMSDIYVTYKDSVNNEENRKATIKKQLQYVFEKKATADSVKTVEQQKVKDAEIKAGKAQLAQEKTARYALFGGLALVLAFAGFLYNRFRTIRRQKEIIESQKAEVEHQKELVDHKQKEILDSIYYARRIQSALITPERYIHRSLLKLKS